MWAWQYGHMTGRKSVERGSRIMFLQCFFLSFSLSLSYSVSPSFSLTLSLPLSLCLSLSLSVLVHLLSLTLYLVEVDYSEPIRLPHPHVLNAEIEPLGVLVCVEVKAHVQLIVPSAPGEINNNCIATLILCTVGYNYCITHT